MAKPGKTRSKISSLEMNKTDPDEISGKTTELTGTCT